MAEKEFWMGTFGPFIFDDDTPLDPDNETGSAFAGSTPKSINSDSPARVGAPVDSEDAMRQGDVAGVYQVVEVADITDPTELNSISGVAPGSTILAIQKVAGDYNYSTFYSYDADGPSVSSPQIVDASGSGSERWVAIGGKYEEPGSGVSGTYTVITAIQDNAGTIEYKERDLTFTNGKLTTISSESSWTST